MTLRLEGTMSGPRPVLEDYDTSLGDYAAHKVDLTATTETAAFGIATMDEHLAQLPGEFVDDQGRVVANQQAPDVKLDRAAALARVKEAGVENIPIPENGISPRLLGHLIERRTREKERADVINRYSGGPLGLGSLAGFGISLVSGLLDPLNVGAMMVPGIGQARYSMMLARTEGLLGRLGVDAAVGASRGIAGTVALEPALYAAHQNLMDDYHLLDSLTNVAFGGAMGGVLHVGMGGFHETFLGSRFRAPGADADLGMRGADADLDMRGGADRRVSEPIRAFHGTSAEMRGDSFAAGEGIGPHFGTQQQANAFAESAGGRVFPVDLRVKNPLRLEDGMWENPAGLAIKLRDADIITDAQLGKLADLLKPLILEHKTFDAIPEAALEAMRQQQFKMLRDAIEAKGYDSIVYANINPAEGPGDSYIPLHPDQQVTGAHATPERRTGERRAREQIRSELDRRHLEGSAAERVAHAAPMAREAALRTAVAQSAEGKAPDVEAIIDPNGKASDAAAIARRQDQPESDIHVNKAASEAADARLEAAPVSDRLAAIQAELAKVMAELEPPPKAEVTGEPKAEVKPSPQVQAINDFLLASEQLARAVKAIASCAL